MSKVLPLNPSLENLKNQAKQLLKGHKAGDPKADERFRASRPHPLSSVNPASGKSSLVLRDAQQVIAKEYGFKTWKDLSLAVEKKRQGPSSYDKDCFTHEEIEALITAVGPAYATKAREKLIDALYTYAISLKVAGETGTAVQRLKECQSLAGEDWPSQGMKAGVSAMLRQLTRSAR